MISRFWIGILVGIFLGALSVSASEVSGKLPQVAVLPVVGDEGITAAQVDFLTGQYAAGLIQTHAFTVLDRKQMDYILQEQGFQQSGVCQSSECQLQMGQLLGVEYVIAGNLVRFGSKYAFRSDYIHVGSGKVLHAVNSSATGKLEDVYDTLCTTVAQQLARAVRGDTLALVPTPAQLAQAPVVASAPVQTAPALTVAKAPARPLSARRKIALALWGSALAGGGVGWYFDREGKNYQSDFVAATANQDAPALLNAEENLDAAARNRNISYGTALGTLLVGGVLWYLN